MSIARYVTHFKKFIRSLKYKNAKFPDDSDIYDREKEDDAVALILDKYRNSF